MTYSNPTTEKLVRSLYHNEQGEPIVLTPGQQEIFDIIAGRMYPRSWVGTYTQYGKSFTVGLAVLTRVSHFAEKWTIIAPKTDQARIIMGYVIDHVFDNAMIAKKFEIDKGETADRIRRERSKDKLTFKLAGGRIGGVQILSAQGQKRKNILDAVMGFGSPNIILDESSLLGDDHFAGIFRMLGGASSNKDDNFLMQIGNPFYRNHFYKASRDPSYHKVRIDWERGVEEGRTSMQYIDEARREMRPELFRVLYDVEFPEADAIDDSGYYILIPEADMKRAQVEEVQLVGDKRIGVDVGAGGSGQTVVVLRSRNAAKHILRTGNDDPMVVGPKIVQYAKKHKLSKHSLFVDSVGVGHGMYKYLKSELGEDMVVGVNAGEAAIDDPEYDGMHFLNIRAQMYWRCAQWIMGGGKLKRHSSWSEFDDIRYKEQGKKIKIKSKEEMAKEGIPSPDDADALALTFAQPWGPKVKEFKQKPYVPTTPYEGGHRAPSQSGKLSQNDRRGFGRYAQDW